MKDLVSSSSAGNEVRVLIVDDQRLLRQGLRMLLKLQGELKVVGEANEGIVAETLVERLNPQVVLMDLRMPPRDGVEATRRIKERFPQVQVLVLTTYDDDELVFRSIEAGASGYLLKDIGSDALADAVKAASRGESPLQPSIAHKVLKGIRAGKATHIAQRSETPSLDTSLTGREMDVLKLLGTGATNREIAERLCLTEGTVKNYISSILAKTGLRDRTQAALFAVRQGLIVSSS